MKILQLVSRRQFRGAELSAYHLSAKLIEQGHEILWVGIYPSKVEPLELQGAWQADLPGENKSFFNYRKAAALKKIIQDHEVDIVQANGAETIKYAVAAKLMGVNKPVIYRNISQVGFWMKGAPLKKIFTGFLLSKANQIISVGDASRNDMILNFPRFEKKTMVIRRGVPLKPLNKTEAASALRARYGLQPNTKILFWAGAFSKEKNMSLLLEVMKEKCIADESVVLIMAGSGPLFDEIKDEIDASEISERIILAGYQKDISLFYAAADIFLLVSLIEGVPGVVLEAAIQHTATISVDVGGVREVIIPNETGIITNSYNPAEFAKTIMNLLNDDTLRDKMGNNAFEFVKDKFDEEKNAQKFVEVYQKLALKK